MQSYTADDGEAIVYRLVEFEDGSGIWWNNYFFYKYDNGKLIPVLNILQNGNAQAFWGPRILWLESKVINTAPLTIKMVYYQKFYKWGEDHFIYGPGFINDSTAVVFKWNKNSKTLQGQYANAKITGQQILTYYVTDNELLFINTHYTLLKTLLTNKKKKKWVLNYLNTIKNHKLQ